MNTSRDIGEIEIQPCGAGCSSEFQPELRRRSLRDEAHEYCFCYLVATVNTKNKHHKLTDIMIVPRARLSYMCTGHLMSYGPNFTAVASSSFLQIKHLVYYWRSSVSVRNWLADVEKIKC